jgi:hypothetical protein
LDKKKMSKYHAHQVLVNEILCELSKSKHIRVWKNDTGAAKSLDGERFVKYGLVGSADIIGINYLEHLRIGQFVAIEVKTGSARQSEEQKRFEKMILDRGGVYILARTVLDATSRLAIARTI